MARRRKKKSRGFAGFSERLIIDNTIVYVHDHVDNNGRISKSITFSGWPPEDSIIKMIKLWNETVFNLITLEEFLNTVQAAAAQQLQEQKAGASPCNTDTKVDTIE